MFLNVQRKQYSLNVFLISFLYKLSEGVKIIIAFGILMTYGLQLTTTADLVWQWPKRRSNTNVLTIAGSAIKQSCDCRYSLEANHLL